MNDLTINDLIEYYENILADGYVQGTDFELNDAEIEIYKMTISCLKMLL